jgi:hypothetical protein
MEAKGQGWLCAPHSRKSARLKPVQAGGLIDPGQTGLNPFL